MLENITFQLDSFEKDLQQWQQRFQKDNKDRLFINYIFISEKIKDKATINILPLIQELNTLKEDYGERYRNKDFTYHTDLALNAAELIKKALRELYDLYRKPEDYEIIKLTWQRHFSALSKRISNIRERISILDRILTKEEKPL